MLRCPQKKIPDRSDFISNSHEKMVTVVGWPPSILKDKIADPLNKGIPLFFGTVLQIIGDYQIPAFNQPARTAA
jgi:hypothetical protein